MQHIQASFQSPFCRSPDLLFQSGLPTYIVHPRMQETPSEFKLRIHILLSWHPTSSTPLLPLQSSQRQAETLPQCFDPHHPPVLAPLLSPSSGIFSTKYSASSSGYRSQVRFLPLLVSAIADVNGWIDCVTPWRRSLGDFGSVMNREGGH